MGHHSFFAASERLLTTLAIVGEAGTFDFVLGDAATNQWSVISSCITPLRMTLDCAWKGGEADFVERVRHIMHHAHGEVMQRSVRRIELDGITDAGEGLPVAMKEFPLEIESHTPRAEACRHDLVTAFATD